MGWFDFMSTAGEDKITAKVEVSPQRINELRQENIVRNIAKLGVDSKLVTVSVDGEVATLTGSAPDQAMMEKIVLCAGNQHGIGKVDCRITIDPPAAAPTDKAAPADPSQAESTFYTVKSGDTLGKIAAEFYGSASKYPVIFEANKPMLSDPNKIYPGQSLRIPPI
ncbi:MAG: peptidoglycan-binding protein LysM [Halioglobus sp.]